MTGDQIYEKMIIVLKLRRWNEAVLEHLNLNIKFNQKPNDVIQ